MSAIERLTAQLASATALLEGRAEVIRDSDDFMGRMSRESLSAHVEDLYHQLRIAKRQRAVEVIQVRLLGRLAEAGSLPLYLLSQLAAQLADVIHATSQKLKSGKRVRRISSAIINQLDLRLAELAPGSTRLFITGNAEPDLFGLSLLENSFETLFELFEVPTDDELARVVSTVGIRSARGVREFLTTLKASELEVELSWRDAENHQHLWRGDYQSISRLARSLGSFQLVEPSFLTVTGSVISLSARGKFEIEADGRIYSGAFPADILPQVANVHIREEVTATLERTVIINTVTSAEKVNYTLVSISPIGQSRLV